MSLRGTLLSILLLLSTVPAVAQEPQHAYASITKTFTAATLSKPVLDSVQTETVDHIIRQNVEAAVGQAAIEAVRNVSMKLHIAEAKSAYDAVYVADREGRMRIDVYVGSERVYTEAYDGHEAWSLAQGSTKGETEDAVASATLQRGVLLPGKVFGLHELRQHGGQIDLGGREMVDGINYFVLKFTLPPDGFVTHAYVNPNTFLIERMRDIRAIHPGLDPATKWLEIHYTDFRKVDGVVRAFKDEQIDLRTGTVLQTTVLQSVQVNGPPDPTVFLRPK